MDRRHCDRQLFPLHRSIGTGSGLSSMLNPLSRYTPPPVEKPVMDKVANLAPPSATANLTPFPLSLGESDVRNKPQYLGGDRHTRSLMKGTPPITYRS